MVSTGSLESLWWKVIYLFRKMLERLKLLMSRMLAALESCFWQLKSITLTILPALKPTIVPAACLSSFHEICAASSQICKHHIVWQLFESGASIYKRAWEPDVKWSRYHMFSLEPVFHCFILRGTCHSKALFNVSRANVLAHFKTLADRLEKTL